jgi:XTP/dITP diphosphohydrolase
MELIFASHNANKAKEIEKKLDSTLSIRTLGELGLHEDITENGLTLTDNAQIKARYVFEKTERNCFADDTGLEVAALGGEPGVHSARYAGDERSDDKNMQLLLNRLEGNLNRRARFVTVICLIWNGGEFLFEGVLDGEIGFEKAGTNGFGYDPLFVPAGYTITLAQMSLEEKNKISHRAKAIEKLKLFFETLPDHTKMD